MWFTRSRLAAVLAVALGACSSDESKPDDHHHEIIKDGTLQRAHSNDGKILHAYFDKAVKPGKGDVRLEVGGAPVNAPVGSVAYDGNHTTITLATPLPKGPIYTLHIDTVTAEGKGSAELKGTLHLALIWHQHQPSYIDAQGDWVRGPWVRKHGTKDYFDMAAMLGGYPDIHVMVNLTPILLMQLEDYYLARVGPFVDVGAGTIDAAGYFAQRPAGLPVTDPWLDMLLKDTPAPAALTEEERGWFYKDIWSTFSISDVMIARWPAYKALRDKRDAAPETFTQDDLLQMKGYFQLAWFDPDFLVGPVNMPDGTKVNLSDLVTLAGGSYTLKAPFTEAICKRLVVEEYKVLENIVGAHKKLIYDAAAKTGQIEVMATPFFHPILPLLFDSDLAKVALPGSPMPQTRFQQPEDARWNVKQAARTFQLRFGKPVTGMWPAEGSVAEEVVGLFAESGVKWVATDRLVLERSTPKDQSIYSPYRIDTDTATGDGGDTDDELAIVFRDTGISDKLGFQYQGGTPEANVADLMTSLRSNEPAFGDERLLSIILDGENAWEWYVADPDAKGFLHGMYEALTAVQVDDEMRTVTVSEYLSGNDARKVAAHPTHDLPELEPLYPGSWIGGSFSTWIGEDEENLAWDYLHDVREDLARFEEEGLARPAVEEPVPTTGSKAWHAYKAWTSMYAAEGSDWFWWYGSDQTAAGGDEPFDRIYIELLKSVYRHAKDFGIDTEVPDFAPILRFCQAPRGTLTGTPVIDGAFSTDDGGDASKPNEWTLAGSGACMDVDSGATGNPDDVIKNYYHGISTDAVWVALRLSQGAAARLGTDWHLRLYFSHKHIVSLDPLVVDQDDFLAKTRANKPLVMQSGGAAREVDVNAANATARVSTIAAGDWNDGASVDLVEFATSGDVVEVRIPYSLLKYSKDDPLELLAVVVKDDVEVDRAPNLNSVVVVPDRTKLVELTFVVDATGTRLALTAVKGIDNPPPPTGTGKVYIVGSLDEIGNWTPNTVPMADDGVTFGDETAHDNLWTFQLLLQPLTTVNYKYTIGNAGDGWGPTEEYPLTNRGFVLNDTNGDGKMLIRDVFADRPEPSGSLPPLAEIVNP